jgi:hypothetical protein
MGRNEKGEWGLPLGAQAQLSLVDLVGMSFFPLYSVVGPLIFFLSLLLMVWGGLRLIVTTFLRVIIIVRYRGCGVWVLTAFWEHPVSAGLLPLQLDRQSDGGRRSPSGEDAGE